MHLEPATEASPSPPHGRVDILIPGIGRPYVDGDSLDLSTHVAFTIADVLTPDDCRGLIGLLEGEGFDEAPISTPYGAIMNKDVRNNRRVMFDHEELAGRLYTRIADTLPRVCGGTPGGVNERFRAYRYEPGQRFAPHFDGCFRRNDRECSELTFMIYLNDDFGGGTTMFHDHGVDVQPRTGMALLFQHRVLHEGSVVTRGIKYVLRSDIMYRT